MPRNRTESFANSGQNDRVSLDSAAKSERAKLLAERDAARADRDARIKAQDEAAAGKARYKVNEASRRLGELHSEAYMADKHPDFVKVYPPAGAGSRAGDFDQVWQRVRRGPQGDVVEFLIEHIVIEAKGGGSGLGTAMAGALRVEQGTPECFALIVKKMSTGTPAMRKAAISLRDAGPNGVKYVRVQVPIEAGPVGGAASTVTRIETVEFDLGPKTP